MIAKVKSFLAQVFYRKLISQRLTYARYAFYNVTIFGFILRCFSSKIGMGGHGQPKPVLSWSELLEIAPTYLWQCIALGFAGALFMIIVYRDK